MNRTVLVAILLVAFVSVARACTDNKDCTANCPDNYHEQCDTKTSSCACAPTRPCSNNSDCPSGSGVGCPPDDAKCVSGSCFCFR